MEPLPQLVIVGYGLKENVEAERVVSKQGEDRLGDVHGSNKSRESGNGSIEDVDELLGGSFDTREFEQVCVASCLEDGATNLGEVLYISTMSKHDWR